MKIPQSARYNVTVFKAYEFIQNNITDFPVNLFELIKKFKWGLLTYEELALKQNCTIHDVIEVLGKDGYSIYNGKNYTIVYNNKINSKGRINFTLAHEIGHIILGHHKDFDVTSVLKDNFTKEEYKVLENEANCFARNILAPAPLVQCLNTYEFYFKLSKIFNLSPNASNTRRTFYKNDLYYLNDQKIDQMQLRYKRYNICKKCSAIISSTTDSYCSKCGNNNFLLGDVFTMKEYKGINIDETHECPRCENYDLQSEDLYCKICGLKLKNECISCHMELDSSARYCTQCGCITNYFQAGLLKDWEIATDVIEKNNSENTTFEPIFQNLDSTDNLPF